MNPLQKLIQVFKKKKVVHIDLDPDSVKEHNTIRALANENAELKALIAKEKARKGIAREREKDKEEEERVRYELNESKQELQKINAVPYLSLRYLFNKLKSRKFRDRLFITSFDKSEKIARFGDIGFTADNRIVLIDNKGNEILGLQSLKDIFFNVGGLGNEVKSGFIPINLSKNGEYVENLMVWEAPELTPTENGKFRYTKARKRYFYEYLNELREHISDQQNTIEELELTNTKLQQEIDQQKIATRVSEDAAETSRAELGQAEKSVSAIHRVFRGTERELAQLRDLNVILEDDIEKLSNQIEKLRAEADVEGTKKSLDRALEIVQNIKRGLVRDEPSKEVQVVQIPTQIQPKIAPKQPQN